MQHTSTSEEKNNIRQSHLFILSKQYISHISEINALGFIMIKTAKSVCHGVSRDFTRCDLIVRTWSKTALLQ